MRQAEISNEWYEIEIALRNQEFWGFLNTKPIEEVSSAIELIFKLIAGEDSKNYSTYLWFEKQIKSDNPLQEKKNAEELWTKTKQIFYKFKFWFETNTLYHHLGFLLINDDKSMTKLKKIIENSEFSSFFRAFYFVLFFLGGGGGSFYIIFLLRSRIYYRLARLTRLTKCFLIYLVFTEVCCAPQTI